jgi:drug/metabolite transporter (DMT)-like permease
VGNTNASDATRIKLISAVALSIASVVSIFGGMIYQNESKYSSTFFEVLGVLYMPGLTVAAVVGGALGIGRIHDPSLVLAGIVNFLLYGLGAFFALKRAFKRKKQTDPTVRE